MKITQILTRRILGPLAVLALYGTMTHVTLQAAGGSGGGGTAAVKPALPVDDKAGTVKSSGGGKSSVTPTPTPAPAPVSAPAPLPALPAPTPLTTVIYTAAGPVNGVEPVCTGSYQIDQYYPTLMDMTVTVHVSSLNVPDGTVLYINVAGTGALYPYTSNAIVVLGGSGSCVEKVFSLPGDRLTGVLITDVSGNAVFAGN